eukprot:TRINITY_DN1867_c0_g1_i1.p1 TRINITY_DN1867_c0_g1~~TRINITY_DN1867_c0_g1_i1.p1  ORF type:complete len:503 (+),score=117.86 TRINITY_DN1867_c0_g1_i1:136-1509(+)
MCPPLPAATLSPTAPVSPTSPPATAFSTPLPHAPSAPPVAAAAAPPISTSAPPQPVAAAMHRSFKPAAPVPIPRPRHASGAHRAPSPSAAALDPSPTAPMPRSLPHLSPSYPASLFGSLSPEDEHVTVWEPLTGKTVAGNAAPYRRNLRAWLDAHPGWEEKADELKSSKRRSAARRARAAAQSFSVLCCYPVAAFLADDAAKRLHELHGVDAHSQSVPACDDVVTWSADDFVRLQEALFTLAQHCHTVACAPHAIDAQRWNKVLAAVGAPKTEGSILYCTLHLLKRGMAKHGGQLLAVGSPASVSSYDVMHAELGAALIERSFRTPREPRVTVWNPVNGRTISGNAAPCRRNLRAWMQQHPGWVPKEEGQLSSSRRNRNRKVIGSRSQRLASSAPESAIFNDALEGLLELSQSSCATVLMTDEEGGKKIALTSSVSSSSGDEDEEMEEDDEVELMDM